MLYNASMRPDSLAYKLRSKDSQVQHIIGFSSKKSLSEHRQLQPAPLLATSSNTVQLERENNSTSVGENYIAMTTQKFNYQQEGVEDVPILCVSACAEKLS